MFGLIVFNNKEKLKSREFNYLYFIFISFSFCDLSPRKLLFPLYVFLSLPFFIFKNAKYFIKSKLHSSSLRDATITLSFSLILKYREYSLKNVKFNFSIKIYILNYYYFTILPFYRSLSFSRSDSSLKFGGGGDSAK